MKYYALIVAGGTGSRINAGIPKQFLLLNGKPVLMHTIQAFHSSDLKPQILVALHPEYLEYWKDCCMEASFSIPHTVIPGGKNRFESVKNGLEAIDEDSIVAIHDAVRPVVANEIITTSFYVAQKKGNAITSIASRDSIRQVSEGGSRAIARENIYLVQTPQTFRSKIIKEAYKQQYSADFTDDASVAEKNGVQINLIEGSTKNIKITFSEDILIASCFLNEK